MIGVSDTWGKAERTGTVQPEDEKAQGDLFSVYMMRGLKKMDPGFSQQCPSDEIRGNGCKLKHKIPSKCEKKHFLLW